MIRVCSSGLLRDQRLTVALLAFSGQTLVKAGIRHRAMILPSGARLAAYTFVIRGACNRGHAFGGHQANEL